MQSAERKITLKISDSSEVCSKRERKTISYRNGSSYDGEIHDGRKTSKGFTFMHTEAYIVESGSMVSVM